jgi:AcrR family transcriptional regulator
MKRRMSAGGRREQILEGAMRLFAQKGFRGTTTREIARRLGISEALMFKYFPSKEALYRAIIQKKTDGSEEMFFPKEAIQAKDDRQVFRSIASYLIQKNTEDPTFMRLVLYSALERHDLSKIFFENHAVERTKLLSEYIRQRIKEKAFKKVPPMLAARAFMGMVMHYVQAEEIYGMKNTSHFSQKRVVDTLVDAFLNGLKGSPSGNESGEGKSSE